MRRQREAIEFLYKIETSFLPIDTSELEGFTAPCKCKWEMFLKANGRFHVNYFTTRKGTGMNGIISGWFETAVSSVPLYSVVSHVVTSMRIMRRPCK